MGFSTFHWSWWLIFNLFVLAMLVLDLKVFHRRAHAISIREALGWTIFWIVLSLLFNLGIYLWQDKLFPEAVAAGRNPALEFLTGYLIEKSLSMDNLFVFLMLFGYFGVLPQYQHKVLFWGILGALVLRAVFIFLGVALIAKFHFIIYVFGVFLVFTGIKMAVQKDREVHPESNPFLKLVRRFLPLSKEYRQDRFAFREGGRLFFTPLFIVLVVVETTDIIFAVDSIPAVLAITLDPFIVYTSNVFAILGLRALYFALAGLMRLFHLLNYGLSFILIFVGVKMAIGDLYKIPTAIALSVVGGLLLLSVVASLLVPVKAATPNAPPAATADRDERS